jgi:putative SOS response-associated peptidase YedK
MCFYSSNSKRALALAKRFGRKTDIVEMAKEIIEEQKYKISAFTHPYCPIITENQSIEVAKWGLVPSWTKTVDDANKISKMCLNARSETVFTLPSFRSPILSKRCLIPATGYFEFHHNEKAKIPYYIFLKKEEIFAFGGIYEMWKNPVTKQYTQTFTILTVPANELCGKIHNGGKTPFRMPLIISKEHEEYWLDRSLKNADIEMLFQSFDTDGMDAYPISKDFLKRSPDDASIVERAA